MQYKLHILIFSSLLFFFGLFFLFFFSNSALAAPCHSLDSTKPIPANFGASYNLHSTDRETLLTSNCNPPAVDISVGNGADTTYIWNKAHYWRNGAWEEIILNPTAATVGDWIIGRGDGVINNISAAYLDNINYYIAYTCHWNGSIWQCGCRDAGCADRYWQEQRFGAADSCTDADGDRYISEPGVFGCGAVCGPARNQNCLGGSDCGDNNNNVNPGASEDCATAYDDNCNDRINENCQASYTCGANGCESGLGENCSNCPGDCFCAGSSWRFVVAGDTRSGHNDHAEVIEGVVNKVPNNERITYINTGDITGNGADSQWQTWSNIIAPLNINWTKKDPPQYIGAVGNHDDNQAGWQDRWVQYLPAQAGLSAYSDIDAHSQGLYGSAKHDNAIFIWLDDSNRPSGQEDFIQRTLERAASDPLVTWKFVAAHQPPIPCGAKSEVQYGKDLNDNYFVPYGVDILFLGHAHYYERTCPFTSANNKTCDTGNRGNNIGDTEGVIHLIAGGGGAGIYYSTNDCSWLEDKAEEHHFLEVEINNNILQAKTWSTDNGGDNPVLIDEFTITKSSPAGSICTDADSDGYIVEASMSGCSNFLGYNDCDDNNRYINYNATEICSNFDPANSPVDDNCNNQTNEAGCRTIITSLSPANNSVSAGEDIVINYSLNTSIIPLERVELWRSFDANNNQVADDGGWTRVEHTSIINSSGSLTDNSSLSAGSYFYGLHAVDRAGNWATEGGYGPDRITVSNVPSDYRNFYGISWRGTASDNLKFAKHMGYDYVAYQGGMENLPDAAGMKFYFIDPEYSVYPTSSIMDYTNTYTPAEQQIYEQYMAWKSNDPFPHNIATGWFWSGNTDRFRVEPDWQQQAIIEYFTQNIIDFAKSKENLSIGFSFGGLMWDVPGVKSRFWTKHPDDGGTSVDLGYWTGISGSCLAHSGITHEYTKYSEGWYAHYKDIFTKIEKEFPDAKFIIEPYYLYQGWISLIENRSDKDELMFDMLVQEGQGTSFVDDSRIFSSGMIARSDVGCTTPKVSGHADNLKIFAKAAINGSWFSWFGRFGGTGDMPNYKNIYEVPARLQLIRAMANWENVTNVPLSSRSWNGFVYQSPNAYGDSNIIYSRHPRTGEIFVVWLNTNGFVRLKAGESVLDVQRTDSFFMESGDGSADVGIAGNEIRLKNSANTNKGYIITISL